MLPTLLFLPGTLCDERVWWKPYQALCNEWPCVVIDYRLQNNIAAMAATALASVTGAIIPIGHSMGGIVALEMWRQAAHRIVALALFDSDPGPDTPERRTRRDAQLALAIGGNFRAMVETQLLPTYFSLLRSDEIALRDTVIAMAIDQGAPAFAAQAEALASRPDSWPQLADINIPTLIACGAEDRICPPDIQRRMASRLPASTFEIIADAGHFVPLEQPGVTTRLLRNWLGGLAIS